MAMTKAEKAVMDQLRVFGALRWPVYEEPQRTLDPNGVERVVGWDMNTYTGEVYRAWASSVAHGTFYKGKPSGGSQGGRRLYATEKDALLALRWATSRLCAERLDAVDRRITDTLAQGATTESTTEGE